MVNAPKKNLSSLQAGNYSNSTKQSTCRSHQTTEGKCSLEADRVPALGGLHSLRSKMKLVAEKSHETQYLGNKDNEKLIKDYVDRETTVARMSVQDAETAIMQELNAASNAESAGEQPESLTQSWKKYCMLSETIRAIWHLPMMRRIRKMMMMRRTIPSSAS